jgi:hypothetical protein
MHRFLVIQPAHLHRRFVIAPTNQNTSAEFFQHRCTPCVLELYNQLCAIQLGCYDIHYQVLRASSLSNSATSLLLCHLVGPQHRRPYQLHYCIYIIVPVHQ